MTRRVAVTGIELVSCALALAHGVVPPYVPRTARAVPLRNVLSVGSGFGGFQSAVVLRREGAGA